MLMKINKLPSDFLDLWLKNDWLKEYPIENAAFRSYYHSYLNNFSHHTKYSYDQNLLPAINLINTNKIENVLDIGSGSGTDALYFSELGCNTTGIEFTKDLYDLSKVRLDIYRKINGLDLNVNFINETILNHNMPNGYDLIYMHQVFHHLEPRNQIISKVANLLKPKGFLVISEANFYNIALQIFLLNYRYKTSGNPFKTILSLKDPDGFLHQWGDERILPAYKLKNLFKVYGIDLYRPIEYYKFLPNRSNLSFDSNAKFLNSSNTTLNIEKKINKYFPNFLKRISAFSYNYIGIKR